MIAIREVLPPYSHLARGEDRMLVSQLTASREVALIDEPRLYCYTVTGLNASNEGHFNKMVRNAQYTYRDTAYQRELGLLATRMPILAYAQTLEDVRPRTGFCDYSLADAAGRRTTLRLACPRCGHEGQYQTDRLLRQFGPHVTLHDLKGALAHCPDRGIACQIDYVDPLDG